MPVKTISLDLPEEVLHKAEELARRRQIPVTNLMVETLIDAIGQQPDYDTAHRQHQKLLMQGFELGTQGRPPATRTELHERDR